MLLLTKKEMKAVHQKTYRESHREEITRQQKTYSQTEAGKKSHSASQVKQRQISPEKIKARNATGNAVKAGRLVKEPCHCREIRVEGHHEDYDKPLEVIWLCKRCHMGVHGIINAGQ